MQPQQGVYGMVGQGQQGMGQMGMMGAQQFGMAQPGMLPQVSCTAAPQRVESTRRRFRLALLQQGMMGQQQQMGYGMQQQQQPAQSQSMGGQMGYGMQQQPMMGMMGAPQFGMAQPGMLPQVSCTAAPQRVKSTRRRFRFALLQQGMMGQQQQMGYGMQQPMQPRPSPAGGSLF
jgi:hypothetical protein